MKDFVFLQTPSLLDIPLPPPPPPPEEPHIAYLGGRWNQWRNHLQWRGQSDGCGLLQWGTKREQFMRKWDNSMSRKRGRREKNSNRRTQSSRPSSHNQPLRRRRIVWKLPCAQARNSLHTSWRNRESRGSWSLTHSILSWSFICPRLSILFIPCYTNTSLELHVLNCPALHTGRFVFIDKDQERWVIIF